MSPKRVPTRTKRLRNTDRKDRAPKRDPLPSTLPLTGDSMPEELAADPVARAEWQRIAPVLITAKRVSSVDRALLIAACTEWSRYIRATRVPTRGDMTVTRGSGGKGIAPSLAVAHRALQSLLRLWPELGLTPRARAELPLDGPPVDGDAFSEFDAEPPIRRPS